MTLFQFTLVHLQFTFVEQIHQTVQVAGVGHNEFTVISLFPALALALALRPL